MPLKTYHEDPPTLNLTSMIDVVFLLVIFFMVGTKFTELERKIELEVPQVGNVQTLTSPLATRVINVYRDGSITIDRMVVSLDELQRVLQGAIDAQRGTRVLIRGDADGAFQNVASVLGVCRAAGIQDMGISVRLAGGGQGSPR